MVNWNPFSKKKAGTVPAVPDVEGGKGAWEPQEPGLLFTAATHQDAKPSKAEASTSPPPPTKEEATGLLGFGKKKKQPQLEAAVEPVPEKTLKDKFKSQKGVAGIGILVAVLVIVLSLFQGGLNKILNLICGIAGFLSCLFYFFAAAFNKGKTWFFYSSLACMAFGVAIWITNLVWLIQHLTSAVAWLSVPFTAVSLVAIAGQVAIVGWLTWRNYRYTHAEKLAKDMMDKAQEFVRQVG